MDSESEEAVLKAYEDDVAKKDEAEVDDDELVVNEGVAPKIIRDPGQPSEKERREHSMTHVPYRSWCPHCVRGRAKGRLRRRLQDQEVPEMPRAAID